MSYVGDVKKHVHLITDKMPTLLQFQLIFVKHVLSTKETRHSATKKQG